MQTYPGYQVYNTGCAVDTKGNELFGSGESQITNHCVSEVGM